MARIGLCIFDDDHWTDKQGYTEQLLPPGWSLERFQGRWRRGDVIMICLPHQIPEDQNAHSRFKYLVWDDSVMSYEDAVAKWSQKDMELHPQGDSPLRLIAKSHSRYTMDFSRANGRLANDLSSKKVVDFDPTRADSIEVDKESG